jgi:hypothetical protein
MGEPEAEQGASGEGDRTGSASISDAAHLDVGHACG